MNSVTSSNYLYDVPPNPTPIDELADADRPFWVTGHSWAENDARDRDTEAAILAANARENPTECPDTRPHWYAWVVAGAILFIGVAVGVTIWGRW